MLITKSPLTNVPEQVGPECVVVFPGLPCEVMMLPEPLKTVVPPRAPHPQPCIPNPNTSTPNPEPHTMNPGP